VVGITCERCHRTFKDERALLLHYSYDVPQGVSDDAVANSPEEAGYADAWVGQPPTSDNPVYLRAYEEGTAHRAVADHRPKIDSRFRKAGRRPDGTIKVEEDRAEPQDAAMGV
jgi:hypothetical protein